MQTGEGRGGGGESIIRHKITLNFPRTINTLSDDPRTMSLSSHFLLPKAKKGKRARGSRRQAEKKSENKLQTPTEWSCATVHGNNRPSSALTSERPWQRQERHHGHDDCGLYLTASVSGRGTRGSEPVTR